MKASFACADKYEAQKLAGMTHSEEGAAAQLAEILDVIDTECVIVLRDSSVHSVLLRDAENAAQLADFVQSVRDGTHAIAGSEADGETVVVEKR